MITLRKMKLIIGMLCVLAFVCVFQPDPMSGQENKDLGKQLKTLQNEPLLDSILNKMDEQFKKIDSLKLTFKQTKTLMLMAQPVQSEGVLIFMRPSNLFWQFYNPDQTVMVLKGTQLVIHYPDLNQADVFEIEKYRDRVAKYLGFTESMTKLKRYYDIRVIEEGQDAYLLELIPKRRRIKQKIERLEIRFNKVSYLPEKIDYLEPNGDTTQVKILDSTVNGRIDPALFDYMLPEGTKINYPMKEKKSNLSQEEDD